MYSTSTAQHSRTFYQIWFSFVLISIFALAGCGGSGGGSTSGTTLAVPTGVVVTNVYSTQIDLNWTKVTGATGYNVYGSAAADLTVSPANKKNITPVVAGSASSITGLAASTKYYFLVTPLSGSSESVGSSIVSATTSPPVALPTPPTGLSATAMNDMKINSLR